MAKRKSKQKYKRGPRPSKSFNFLGLPAALRNYIYELAIPPTPTRRVARLHLGYLPVGYHGNAQKSRVALPAMTQVSKQLRREALPIFFSRRDRDTLHIDFTSSDFHEQPHENPRDANSRLGKICQKFWAASAWMSTIAPSARPASIELVARMKTAQQVMSELQRAFRFAPPGCESGFWAWRWCGSQSSSGDVEVFKMEGKG